MSVLGLRAPEAMMPLRLGSRGELRYVEGLSAAAKMLPPHVVERQSQQALGRLASQGYRPTMEQAQWDCVCPGAVVFLRAVFGRTVAGFFALGQKGKSAEQVADEAVGGLLDFVDSPATVDAHAADQLLTLTALCPGHSHFITRHVTDHLLTNAQVIRQLTGRTVRIDAAIGECGQVTVEGIQ